MYKEVSCFGLIQMKQKKKKSFSISERRKLIFQFPGIIFLYIAINKIFSLLFHTFNIKYK